MTPKTRGRAGIIANYQYAKLATTVMTQDPALRPHIRRMINDRSWPQLAATLRAAERSGADPAQELARALQSVNIARAREPAALLNWRLTNNTPLPPLSGVWRDRLDAAAPGAAAAPTSAPAPTRITVTRIETPPAPTAATPTGPTTPQRAEQRPDPATAIPAAPPASWRDRPNGAMTDQQLESRLALTLERGRAAARQGRRAEEQGTAARESALAGRGPLAQALIELQRQGMAIDAVVTAQRRVQELDIEVGKALAAYQSADAALATGGRDIPRRARADLEQVRGTTETRADQLRAQKAEAERELRRAEAAAPPEARRQEIYTAWLTREVTFVADLSAAKAADVRDAEFQLSKAAELTGLARDLASEHSALLSEAAVRRALSTAENDAEDYGRLRARTATIRDDQASTRYVDSAAAPQVNHHITGL